jgi:hypothetical protein
MRTIKALACAAALVAGLATAVAQNVYSLNVVGYYNVTCPSGTLVQIANQLNTTNNTLGSLLANAGEGDLFYKWIGYWDECSFSADNPGWSKPDVTLAVGEAGFYKAAADSTLTFVGEVLQGNLSNGLTPQATLLNRASMVPQAGLVTTDLGFPGQEGDLIYKWLGYWDEKSYSEDNPGWSSEPTFGVGEGFLVKKASGGTATAWVRNFTVQ